MRRFGYIILIAFTIAGLRSQAQDPQFTQFYSNPLYQAPSFAGGISGYRVSAVYRDQWPKMPGLLTTINVAADANLDKINSGVGIIALRDVAGSANYSYNPQNELYTNFQSNCTFKKRLNTV